MQTILAKSHPLAVRDDALPRRASYHPSPADWRDEVIYFLLPDRFSDGQERSRPLLDPNNRRQFRPDGWRWDHRGSRLAGEKLAALQRDGTAYIATRDVAPSEVVVLINRPRH